MNHQDLVQAFPHQLLPQMRKSQEVALKHLAEAKVWPVVHQLPVGSGKTALGYTFLKALKNRGAKQLLFATPNKTQVEQIQRMFPEAKVALGRSEHPCLYPSYTDAPRADEIPCHMNVDCPHRVNLTTGETYMPGATPCPYLQQKYEAMQGGLVVCTHAFLVFNVLLSKAFTPEGLVVDEAHRLAQSFRSVLSTDITDWRITRAMERIQESSPQQCANLAWFLASLQVTVKGKALDHEVLLDDEHIKRLYEMISRIDVVRLERDVHRAVRAGRINLVRDRDMLKEIEGIVRSVRRFQHALKFSLSGEGNRRYPLAYVIAYGRSEMGPHDKVQYRLTIKDYYVVPLVKKIIPEMTYAFSATVVDPELFSYETGIFGSFMSVPSEFPPDNTRVYMPVDTLNLAEKRARRRDKTRMLRLVTREAKRFADKGHRSLIIVASNEERHKIAEMAAEEGLHLLSYGNGMPARECAQRFKDGEGSALVGTKAQFGEGLDLPANTAPVIFYLRPSYPRPDEAQTLFEERRFGSRRWQLWQWRVMVDLLQVRGRNVRSATDLGVTFLISQQFRNFAFGTLPDWLKSSYHGNLSWKECVQDAEDLLARIK